MRKTMQPDLALMLQSLQEASLEIDARRERVFTFINSGTCFLLYNPLQSLLEKADSVGLGNVRWQHVVHTN